MQKEKRCFEVIPKLCGGPAWDESKLIQLRQVKPAGFGKNQAEAQSPPSPSPPSPVVRSCRCRELCVAQIALSCPLLDQKMAPLFIDHSTEIWNFFREGLLIRSLCSIQKGGCHEKNFGGPCRYSRAGHFGRAACPCTARARRGCRRRNYWRRYRRGRDCGHYPVSVRIWPRILRAWPCLCGRPWWLFLAAATLLGWIRLAVSPRLGLRLRPIDLPEPVFRNRVLADHLFGHWPEIISGQCFFAFTMIGN
jgi:hypothetical protein